MLPVLIHYQQINVAAKYGFISAESMYISGGTSGMLAVLRPETFCIMLPLQCTTCTALCSLISPAAPCHDVAAIRIPALLIVKASAYSHLIRSRYRLLTSPISPAAQLTAPRSISALPFLCLLTCYHFLREGAVYRTYSGMCRQIPPRELDSPAKYCSQMPSILQRVFIRATSSSIYVDSTYTSPQYRALLQLECIWEYIAKRTYTSAMLAWLLA